MKNDSLYLQHIYERTGRVCDITARVTKDEFFSDYLYQDAVLRSLEVIGEAANRLSPEFSKDHPEIMVKDIVGLRNILIHKYHVVDVTRVWIIATEDVPILRKQISALIM